LLFTKVTVYDIVNIMKCNIVYSPSINPVVNIDIVTYIMTKTIYIV